MIIEGIGRYPKEIEIPGDKSISHRSIIFSAISEGRTLINNLLISEDVLRTVECFRQMGVDIYIDENKKQAEVVGVGLNGLKKPKDDLYCGNSGTTMRLMAGLLSGQSFDSVLVGDESLNSRPMKRIIEPLTSMGANIKASNLSTAPLIIKGNNRLKPIEYKMPVDSAQVKSAIILASLYAGNDSKILEGNPSRNHTERMLEYFRKNKWKVEEISIPGDISSAAYFIAGGLISPDSEIILRNIGLNKTRTGFIDVIEKMNGKIEIMNIRKVNNEELGDILVRNSRLKGINIEKNIIARLIDEIPILSVIASFAEGKTIISGAQELRHKETDRIKATYRELRKFGVNIKELEDGLLIEKSIQLKPAEVESYGDHRMAMSLTIMAYNIEGKTSIRNSECVDISFPDFYDKFI